MGLLNELAPEIADLEGPAGIEVYCESVRRACRHCAPASAPPPGTSPASRPASPSGGCSGSPAPSVRTSYTIAIGAPEDMLAQARAASAFGTLKVKLGFDGDLELARRLKLELPDTTFRYDANEGWNRERAAAALAVLEDLDAELVEQPLPASDAEGMLWLKERTRIPLLADEAVLTLDDLDAVAEAYDGVVVKLAKTGGIAAAFALVSACTELGLRVLMGWMIESEPGDRRSAADRRPRRLRRPGRRPAARRGPVHRHRSGRRPADRVRRAGAGGRPAG